MLGKACACSNLRFLGACSVVLASALLGTAAGAAHPAPGKPGPVDLANFYAFRSPVNVNNTVFIMTVNPFAGGHDPITGRRNPVTFDPKINYEFKIDNNLDYKADLTFRLTFGSKADDGTQSIRLVSIDRAGTTKLLATGRSGRNLPIPSGGNFRADLFDDPAFFDQFAYIRYVESRDSSEFTTNPTNTFAGANVSGIVLEIPTKRLLNVFNDTHLHVWARTAQGQKQIDRAGLPAVDTLFIAPENRGKFQAALPDKDQEKYRESVVIRDRNIFGQTDLVANFVAASVLPNVISLDTSLPSGFPNGRLLSEDVIDEMLSLATNGSIPGDGVENDSTFRATFPYLGRANE